MNVNTLRNWALAFMFGGFFVMYCGVFNRTLLPYLLAMGGVGVVVGILMYFRYGPVTASIQTVKCPCCGQETRLAGAVDACSHCHQRLRKTETGSYEPDVKATSRER
ncbi:DUF2614 family zinc ribbon-containing protein [Alicyclobacillus sp. ALC3]|uniref:DUF2614 family zinc ribbon-containing protein n=1 Tax=Alicyclobacillus sp. ALC3 TaxID=2796143 RepID=UPI0023799272|nr:DUF2614 family zinc ribbon-containing protein [Alicyclobacillus sp. ALC3]WDL98667.1 hypothetical protein JC200_08395 [Alicyclobacillus sp. ALC3]